MAAVQVTCGSSNLHYLWAFGFTVVALAIGALAAVGVRSLIGRRRDDPVSPFRFGPVRWLACAAPIVAILLVSPATFGHYDRKWFGRVVDCSGGVEEPYAP